MSDRAKKITELTALTAPAGGDLFIIEDVSANTTKSVTLTTLRTNIVVGPYANDAVAASSGVALGQVYYTAAGIVQVRIS